MFKMLTNDYFNGFEDTPEFNEFNKDNHYIDEIPPFFESQSEGIGFEQVPEHLRGLSISEIMFLKKTRPIRKTPHRC